MEEQKDKLDAAPRPRRLTGALWIGALILLLSAQFVLFHRYLVREISWTYPAHHDQATYLRRAYETYERIRWEGILRGITGGREMPNGAILHVQAAVLFLLTGPSRAAALSLNFFYLAVFEVVLVWTLRRVTGGWSAGFIGFGLLLAARTSFAEAGGIADFRLDFITVCLYGLFVCLVVRSRVFLDPRWSVAAGLVGGWLVCFRFVSAAYVAAVIGATILAMLFARLLGRGWDVRRRRGRQLAGALAATAVLVAMALPVLWLHRRALHDYYVVGHVTGHERDIRIEQFHTADWRQAVLFYPRSLLHDQLGDRFGFVVLALLVLLAVDRVTRRDPDAAPTDRAPSGKAFAFVAAAAMLPIAVLSLDAHKSPVVADVAVAPLVVLLAMIAGRLIRRQAVLRGAALLVLVMGGASFFRSLNRPTPLSRHPDEMNQLDRLYDRIARGAEAHRRGETVLLATDCTADYLYCDAVAVMIYERHHVLPGVNELIAGIFERPEDQVLASLRQADFVFLTTRTGRAPRFEYPFDREMERLHPRLQQFCRQHLIEIDHSRVIDRDVTLLASRP